MRLRKVTAARFLPGGWEEQHITHLLVDGQEVPIEEAVELVRAGDRLYVFPAIQMDENTAVLERLEIVTPMLTRPYLTTATYSSLLDLPRL